MKQIKALTEKAVTIFFRVFFIVAGKPKVSHNLQKAIGLYRGNDFGEVFALIRAWDAPYEIIDKIVGKSERVVDLGSGDGLLGNYLAISSRKRKIYGVELNPIRAGLANKGIKNAFFKKGNILKTSIPRCDVIILAHVLHHLPSKNDQLNLISKISKRLTKNEKLIVLEIDKRPLVKYLFTWLTDAVTVPIIFEGKLFTHNFFYRSSNEWEKILLYYGFEVKLKSIHKGMPFSHVLIEAVKK